MVCVQTYGKHLCSYLDGGAGFGSEDSYRTKSSRGVCNAAAAAGWGSEGGVRRSSNMWTSVRHDEYEFADW